MKAAIVTIGDEILIGQITDTNSGYIAKKIDAIGISVNQILSIGDDKEQIENTLKQLQNQVDVVLITGGLGPTKDDITKKIFASYFEDELVENKEVLDHVTRLIEQFYKRPISQINKDQALVPSKAVVLFNEVGTAPGMWMQKEKTVFISMPGVPYEMQYLMDHQVIPRLTQQFDRPHIVHKTLITYGVGESLLAEQIEPWENQLPSFIKLAYLPSSGRVRLRMSAKGTDKTILVAALDKATQDLQHILGDVLVGFDDNEPIEVALGTILRQKSATVATAESCTGGLLASKLVAVSGASAYFIGSIVAYANAIKINELNIDSEAITAQTAVCTAVAEQMAVSIRDKYKSTYGVGITGNAGPTTIEATDLGVVFIAISHPKGVFSERFDFGQPREKVIQRATNKAMELLLKFVSKN